MFQTLLLSVIIHWESPVYTLSITEQLDDSNIVLSTQIFFFTDFFFNPIFKQCKSLHTVKAMRDKNTHLKESHVKIILSSALPSANYVFALVCSIFLNCCKATD